MVGGALPATPRLGQPDPLICHFPRIRLYRFTHFPASSPLEESEGEVEVRRFGQVRVRREDHSFSPHYRSVLAELSHSGKCFPSHVKSTSFSLSLSSHQHIFSTVSQQLTKVFFFVFSCGSGQPTDETELWQFV